MVSSSTSAPSMADGVAETLLAAAIECSTALGRASSIAVVDATDSLKAFLSMDDATLFSVELAQGKARTALLTGSHSGPALDTSRGEPEQPPEGRRPIPGGVSIGGGYPILIDGQLVGGLGVSSDGHYCDDIAIAQSALEALAVMRQGER
jgi:uncharacterized protein GlcG (DUF336 family)